LIIFIYDKGILKYFNKKIYFPIKMTMTFISEGWEGVVYKINEYTVCKIGFKDIMINEYNNFKLLPNKAPIMNLSSVILKNSDKNINDLQDSVILRSIFDHIKTNDNQWLHDNLKNFISIDTFDTTLYEIHMPFIQGKSLDKIDKFTFSLKESLFVLYEQMKELNEIDGIFHNDLNLGNIMYNEENDIITIIDWGYMSLNTPLKIMFEHPIKTDLERIMLIIDSI